MLYRIRNYFLSTGFSNFWLCLSVSFIGTLLVHYVLGSEWDDYDGFAAQLFSGYLTPEPFWDFYSFGELFVGHLYAALHKLAQPVPWFAIFLHFYFITSTTILLFVFAELVKRKYLQIKAWVMFVLTSVIFLLVFSIDIIHLTHTVAFLFSGSALLGIMWLMNQSYNSWRRSAFYLGFLLLFTIGFLTRTETGLGASLVVGVFLLLYEKSFKRLLQILLPPALVAIVIMGYVSYRSNEIPFLKAVELNLFYVADGYQNKPNYSNQSAIDSIKHEAIVGFFVNDESELTVELIQQMAEEKMEYEAANPAPYSHSLFVAWFLVQPRILENLFLCLFDSLLLLFTFLLFFQRKPARKFIVFFVGYQVFFLLTLLSLAYFVKMENRHFIPLLQLHTFCNLLFVIEAGAVDYFTKSFRSLTFFSTLIFALCIAALFKNFQEKKISATRIEKYKAAIEEVNEIGKGKILLLDVNSSALIHGTTFSLVKLPNISKILLYDMGELALIPNYKKYLDKECHCNSSHVPEFYQYLYENREQVLFISTDSRINFIQNYLRIVHHLGFRFAKITGEMKVNRIESAKSPLYYYALE